MVKLRIVKEALAKMQLSEKERVKADEWIGEASDVINTEFDKVTSDILLYGTGIMQDGKHISFNKFKGEKNVH